MMRFTFIHLEINDWNGFIFELIGFESTKSRALLGLHIFTGGFIIQFILMEFEFNYGKD